MLKEIRKMKAEVIKILEKIYDECGATLADLLGEEITVDDIVEAMDQTGLTFDELVEDYWVRG